jgi:glycerol-3-phosphate dehydrogenase
MAEELNWDRARKKKEIEGAVAFLGSMGLAPGAASALQDQTPKTFFERMQNAIWRTENEVKSSVLYSRSRFEAGEVEALRNAFAKRARTVYVGAGEEIRLSKAELSELLNELPGYEGIPRKDFEYVLEEAGFKGRSDVDFDEFVEVNCTFNPSVQRDSALCMTVDLW